MKPFYLWLKKMQLDIYRTIDFIGKKRGKALKILFDSAFAIPRPHVRRHSARARKPSSRHALRNHKDGWSARPHADAGTWSQEFRENSLISWLIPGASLIILSIAEPIATFQARG